MWPLNPALLHTLAMSIFLRIVAVGFLFGGSVHVANILGYGEIKWSEMSAPMRAADVYFLVLDLAIVVGLVMRAWWGVG